MGDVYFFWQLGFRPFHPNYLGVFCKMYSRSVLPGTGSLSSLSLDAEDTISRVVIESLALITRNGAGRALGKSSGLHGVLRRLVAHSLVWCSTGHMGLYVLGYISITPHGANL